MDKYNIITYVLAVGSVFGGIGSALVWIYIKGKPFIISYFKKLLKSVQKTAESNEETKEQVERYNTEIREEMVNLMKSHNEKMNMDNEVLGEVKKITGSLKDVWIILDEHDIMLNDHEKRLDKLDNLELQRIVKKQEIDRVELENKYKKLKNEN